MNPDWPLGVGVGGLSRAAATSSEQDTAQRALAALRGWSAAAGEVTAFPFAELIAHYQCAGRAHASSELTGELRRVHLGLSRRGPVPGWPLRDWLPSTIDQNGGDYNSYLVTALLDGMAGQPAEDLVLALAADLASTEVDALLTGRRDKHARRRAKAGLAVLAKLIGPAAEAALPRGVGGERDDKHLAELAADWAGQAAELVGDRVRIVTEVSLLPVTPLHDERMFIRSLQIFETLYRQAASALRSARDALCRLDPGHARAQVVEALRVLRLSPALYRVVTTMPPDIFAIIRRSTTGRSAIQSRAFRLVEITCAPREPRTATGAVPEPAVAGLTLQEAFRAAADRLGWVSVAGVASAMSELDDAWRAMKRTHWGVTLKIIGSVPGTGGTTGAEYLAAAAAISLFPALAAESESLARGARTGRRMEGRWTTRRTPTCAGLSWAGWWPRPSTP